jgi:hypothetical protein
LDFVKFYIVQLFKSAASRIRVSDKEKEKLLSRLVSKIENSRDLFPDLKMMERVVELEETASKLISIYRRLNKSHIDLEKISYQFVSDRDAVQSILRRFLQGNYRSGILSRKKPKIVFDDTTFTFYELKEPEVNETEEKVIEEIKQPKLDLNEFLKDEKEEIIAIKKDDLDKQSQSITESDLNKQKSDVEEEFRITEESEVKEELEIENGIAKKSISKKIEKTEKEEDALVLPLQFDEGKTSTDQFTTDTIGQKSQEDIYQPTDESFDSEKQLLTEEEKITEETRTEQTLQNFDGEKEIEKAEETLEEIEQLNAQTFDDISEEQSEEEKESTLKEVLDPSKELSNDTLFLEFEKLILQNILEVDEFLNKIINENFSEEEIFRLIQQAYKCFQLAAQLNHDFISELIKVYWLALVAIRDHKIVVKKSEAELIRSTLIVLVSLLKEKDIDLEPFLKKHNLLKEKLQQLQYEV